MTNSNQISQGQGSTPTDARSQVFVNQFRDEVATVNGHGKGFGRATAQAHVASATTTEHSAMLHQGTFVGLKPSKNDELLVSQPSPSFAPGGTSLARKPTGMFVQEPVCHASTAAVRAAEFVSPRLLLTRTSAANVARYAARLRTGAWLPVGSPEFVHLCMRAACIAEPIWNPYPRPLTSHLMHRPVLTTAIAALRHPLPIFVKPVSGHPFRGFVLARDRAAMSKDAYLQMDKLLDLVPSTPVWAAEPLDIVAEWRCYVLAGQVVGVSTIRSADADAELPAEEISVVVAAAPPEAAYAVDVAELANGERTVLCLRDALGLELVPTGQDAPKPVDFVRMLWHRWREIFAAATTASRSAR